VNCLRGIFANFECIMKFNAELQRNESRKQIPKTVLRWYQKNNRLFCWNNRLFFRNNRLFCRNNRLFCRNNRLFCRNNRLFLSTVNKNNLKHIYVRSGKERITQTYLYWFTLTPRATSSPQKSLGNPLCNQNQITHITHQSSDLEPLKKHTTFGKQHQECWSWTPQEHTTLLDNTNTEIQ